MGNTNYDGFGWMLLSISLAPALFFIGIIGVYAVSSKIWKWIFRSLIFIACFIWFMFAWSIDFEFKLLVPHEFL